MTFYSKFFRLSLRRLWVVLFFSGVICVLAYFWFFGHERSRQIEAISDRFKTESILHAAEIRDDLQERQLDLKMIAGLMELSLFSETDFPEPLTEANSEKLSSWFELLLEHEDSHIASFYDRSGTLLLRVHPGALEHSPYTLAEHIPDALVVEDIQPVNLDLVGGEIHFNLVTPVHSPANGRSLVGYLRLDLSIKESILEWLKDTYNGGLGHEALLAKPMGEEIYFFSSLRVEGPVFARPISEARAEPAKQALKGQVGFVAGLDYDGVPVFAWTEYIPELGASLVIKLDQDAVIAPLRQAAMVKATQVGGGCLLLALFYFVISGRSERKQSAQILSAEKAKAVAIEHSLLLEQRFGRAMRESPFPVVLYDASGTILHISQSWLKLSGYEESALATIQDWVRLAHPEDGLQLVERVLRVTEVGESNSLGRFSLRTQDGVARIWEYTSSNIGKESGGAHLFMLMAVDVTGRVQRGNELKLLKRAMDYASNLIYITDTEARIIYANPGVLKVSGYQLEEVLGRNPSIFKSGVHPPQMYENMWETINSGKPFFCEVTNRRKDGSLWHQEGVITPILGEAGEISHYVAIQADISERDELRNQLYHALNGALEASRVKSEFMARISHELRTPMNGIMGMIQLLGMTDVSKEQSELLETADACAVSMMVIVDDLLDLTIAERLVARSEAIDPKSTLQLWIERWQHAAGEKKLKLDLIGADELPPRILADRDSIFKILGKLVSNAIKFSEEGTITVRVEYLPKASGEMLRFLVQDEGRGVPEAYREHIFEPFSQAESAFTRSQGGMGLGLFLAKKMIESVGGRLFYKNRVSGGSTFGFDVNVESVVPEEAVPDKSSGMTSCRVLVAEDDASSRLVIKKMLETLGVSAAFVSNGQEVLDAMAHEAFDLLLLDCHMPVMDGFETTKAIRGGQLNLKNANLRIVALTADVDEECRLKCSRAGMNDFLSKPVTLRQIKDVILRAHAA